MPTSVRRITPSLEDVYIARLSEAANATEGRRDPAVEAR